MRLIAALALLLPFLVHLLLVRLGGVFKEPFSRQKGVILSFLLGFLPLGAMYFLWIFNLKARPHSGIIWSGVYLCLIYTLFSYIYFHIFNMSETARRIRVLLEVHKTGAIKTYGLIQKYTSLDMVSNRLKRLLSLGELRLSGDKFIIGNGLLLLPAKIISRLRDILFHPHTKDFGVGVYFLLVFIPYIIVNLRFLFSGDLPLWDSFSYHFRAFGYIGDSIARGYAFPEWFAASGGVRLGFFHIGFFPFIPHRVIGYYLYSILPISDVFAYKLQYILGVIFMCSGWWLVLRKITRSPYAASFGTLMIMMGGTGITFHQEQVLATTHLIPWFVLSLFNMPRNPRYIFPLAMLMGLGLTSHYPHIQFLSMGIVVIFAVLTHPSLARTIYQKNKKYLFPAFLLFFLSVSPLFYIASNKGYFASPIRNTVDELYPDTYEEYLNLNRQQISSAPLPYYRQYISPIPKRDDNNLAACLDRSSFFVGRVGLVFALIGIVLSFPQALPVIFLLIIFSVLSLGVNSPVPKYLFLMHFPFIGSFRQWFHFFPMVNFCLSVLAGLGFASLVRYFRQRSRTIFSVIILLIFLFQIAELAIYDKGYLSQFVFHGKVPSKVSNHIFSPEDFGPGYVLPSALIQYKNRFRLFRSYRQAIPNEPFLTRDILTESGGIDNEFKTLSEIARKRKKSVVTNIPASVLRQSFVPKRDVSPSKCSGSGSLESDGLFLDINVPESAFLIVPLNYDLGLKAYVDGREQRVYRANAALSGILVKRGEHKIKFKIIPDGYWFIVGMQVAIYAFLILFFILLGVNRIK